MAAVVFVVSIAPASLKSAQASFREKDAEEESIEDSLL